MERPYRKLEITPDSLLGCRFFDDVPREERARIARRCEARCYRPGAEIVRFGDADQDVFFLCSGRVQATLLTSSGKVVTFQQLEGGAMFGELSAIDGEPRSASVVAIDESSLVCMAGQDFKDFIAHSPLLAERTLLRLCALSRFLCERSFEARAYTIPGQIALEILRIVSAHTAPENSLELDPAPSHRDIAQRVGTSREQVTRVMRDLSKLGLLEQRRRHWHVPDVASIVRHLRTASVD
jgi:CRP-like cAMP-binding protein